MSELLAGVVLLPTDGAPHGPPVEVAIEAGRIAAMTPAASLPTLGALSALEKEVLPWNVLCQSPTWERGARTGPRSRSLPTGSGWPVATSASSTSSITE